MTENLVLKLHQEQKHHDNDLRVELEMPKQIKNRRKGTLPSPSQQGTPPPYEPKRECTKKEGIGEDGFMVSECPLVSPRSEGQTTRASKEVTPELLVQRVISWV